MILEEFVGRDRHADLARLGRNEMRQRIEPAVDRADHNRDDRK
jgi:hypothetical protein